MSVFLPGELLLDFHWLAGVKLDPEAHCVRLLSCWKQETHQCESRRKDIRQEEGNTAHDGMQLYMCAFSCCWSVSEKHKTEQSQIEWFRFILLLSLSASLTVLDKRWCTAARINLSLPRHLLDVLRVHRKYVAGAISQSVEDEPRRWS